MNKNKGFIGIGLILAIILGIAVVGGGAYYLGQQKNNQKQVEENNLPLDNQDDVVIDTTKGTKLTECPVGQAFFDENCTCPAPWDIRTGDSHNGFNCVGMPKDSTTKKDNPNSNSTVRACTSSTAPWIQVLNPNGGEVMTIGNTFDIKWKTCNLPTGNVSIFLVKNYSRCFNLQPGQTCSPVIDPQYTITSNIINTGTYQWVVNTTTGDISNNITQGDYYLRICKGSGNNTCDSSDNLFTIN